MTNNLQKAAQQYFQNEGIEVEPQIQQPAQPTIPEPNNDNEWDWKESPVNQRGEQLPSGAEGWTPFGQPWFGSGFSGTVKKYAWSLMGSPTEGDEEERWGRFLELTKSNEFWSDPTSDEFKQGAGELLGGFVGTEATQEGGRADLAKITEANAKIQQITDQYGDLNLAANRDKIPAETLAEYEELKQIQATSIGGAAEGLTSFKVGGQNVSLLSPLVRLTKVGVQAVMDVFSEAAVKFEQTQGTLSAMREYADEQGSPLPDLAFDVDRSKDLDTSSAEFWRDPMITLKSEEAQNTANFASRLLLPLLTTWDAARFITAPGTVNQKIQAAQEGWDAGRILYSQAIKPSLLEEYKRRAAAGEDPQLLAMELQNPWAEGVGQSFFDPLTFVGMASKAVKVAGMLDDATDAVRGGSLGDEAVQLMSDAGKGMPGPLGETRAAERMEKFDDLLTQGIKRIEDQRLTVDFNKATSYSPSGLRVRETKTVQAVSSIVTASIMRNGGQADDVADFFHLISKAVDADKTTRMDAWDQLFTMSQRFGLGRYSFSDDVLETGVLLRNLVEDKDLLTALKAGKGDLAKTAEILNNKFKQAVDKQIPTYTQVKTMAEEFKAGKDASARAEKAAKTYEGIKSKALWNLHEGTVGKARNAINETLGKFYFASFGFGVRNASGNFTHMFVDQGLKGTTKSFFRDGKYWSIGAIEEDIGKWFGGKLPPALGGLSMTGSEGASSVFTKFSEYTESAFAKRIYWRQFRDTMDKFMSPGVALPARTEFKAAGMTDEAIDHFVHVLKNESYGNVEQAIVKYSEKYGENGLLDVWKRWNGSVTKEEMNGLSEIGLTKEIDDIVAQAKTPQEIKQRIDKLRRELMNRADSATDNPIGVNRERKGFEWTEDLGKATDEGMLDVDGTNKLNILLEQSERATDELMQAIGKARDTVQDPALRKQFGIMEEAFSATRRNGTRQTSKQLVDTARDLTKKSRKSTGIGAEALWNQSILAKKGPPPAGLSTQQFRDELWQATRNDVSNTWETYFSEGFDRLTPLIDNLAQGFPELQGIFSKSQKASAELQMYRTAIYRDGKIFYQQPPKTIYELANRYGIATATNTGTPANKQLLATINKYSGQKYKTLDEIPLPEAEKALQARKAGAMTQADAARVEKPTTKKAPQAPQAAQPTMPDEWFSGSKIVDESGQPQTVYHGTNAEFEEFDANKIGSQTDGGFMGKGFYFSTDERVAKPFKHTKKVNLSIKKPLTVEMASFKGKTKRELVTDALGLEKTAAPEEITAEAIRQGYDGVILDYSKTGYNSKEIVAFESSQIRDTSKVMQAAQPVTMEEATQIPRGELPPEVSTRFEQEANRMLDELNSGTGPQISAPRQGEGGAVVSIPSTNVDWYRELPKSLQNKKTLNAALEKIVKDKGSDKGINVERLKEMIIDRFRYGSDGAPPDLKVLKSLGADQKTLQSALDDYNDFTKQELTLDQVLGTAPTAQADEAAGAVDELTDASRPYYDDEGNLVNPTDELGEIRDPTPNPEVQIQPPYVDGSTPIPGQMWKENSTGILAALNKVEAHMLDNYGMKAVDKLDGSQLKALKGLMKNSSGRVTEGIAIADKIGKEWRDFALLPYGETKNFDLALSYAFPYQFWYSRSYNNWMKRIATDPQVIANYARIKESMSRINKDSPEWWRYNVEIPSHFLGLPNEHPMSFNLEANIWPLYGLTGTDFNDPTKRQNWLTATVDDAGKLGPSIWAPVQWAIATAYRMKGEEELAQSWAGRIIPQTATIKAASSYFGQPLELDPGVQIFSGEGFGDLAAMDKYERNRVGRAIAGMVQEGLITQEQGVEIARTQEGPVWDEATRRATQIRAPGQIMSYFLGVGMKARTEEDRITDEFYQEYYRLNNLNEAGLVSPEQYQQSWDGLRDKYPFMDALLLSRKAGPERDRAYAYNVLGRIPPGQATDLYEAVGVDPKVAQQFYDSKGNISSLPESDRDKFMGAMVDLGAMLAIPNTATSGEWASARSAYKELQGQVKQQFGEDIQDKIEHYFSMDDSDQRKAFIEQHPEVQEALSFQNGQVVNNDLLYEFYGGLQSLDRYHKNKMYDQLYEKYGDDISKTWDEYYAMQITDPSGARSFYRKHPELKRYSADKKVLEEQVLRAVVEFGSRLPDKPELELTGNEPQSVGQENIANYASQSTPGFDFWQGEMPEVTTILADYWQNGEEIPYAVTKNLDYMAQNYGYDSGDSLLQAILISMNR